MTLINPVTQYPSKTEEQSQPAPGLLAVRGPVADLSLIHI